LDLLGESAGTSMIRDENRLSRHFRDLKTLTQHVFTARNRYQDIGAMLLGRKPGFDMLGF
jgi:alkylation response protein AidB-like acyl-CoA dehydrogenase